MFSRGKEMENWAKLDTFVCRRVSDHYVNIPGCYHDVLTSMWIEKIVNKHARLFQPALFLQNDIHTWLFKVRVFFVVFGIDF